MKHQLLVLSLLILALSSCKTLEQKCAERFPQETTEVVREVVRTDTIILPDHYIEFVDTTDCPASPEPTQVVKTIIKQLPGDTIYREVVCTDTIAIYYDQEKINYLSAELRQVNEKYLSAKGKATLRTWMFVAACVAMTAMLALFFYHRRKDKN